MSKKIYVPIVIAVLAALAVGLFAVDAAFAQSGTGGLLERFRSRRGTLGQVIEIKNNEFTIQTRDGSQMSYYVGEDTQFVDRERNEMSFDDLVEGGWVAVAAPEKHGEKPEARVVVILPEDFDPENMSAYRGAIAGVNVAAGEFTLKTKDDQEVTFSTGADTLFNGEAADLAGLDEEMVAAVIAEAQADGSLLAQNVRSSYPQARKLGQILAVDPAAGTFTLRGRDGIETTFAVNEETRFRTKGGALNGLDDLQVGMIGMVAAVNDPASADPVARLVIAVNREDLPKADERIKGKVTAVEAHSFTIETREGRSLTVKVTGDTNFRSRDGQVSGLEDIQVGMAVGVAAKELGNGEYQAQVVIVLQPENQ